MPRPRPFGILFLLLTLTDFIAGILRDELVLNLLALVFSLLLAYSFTAILLSALIYRRKLSSLNPRIVPGTVRAGSLVSVTLNLPAGAAGKKGGLFREAPALLIRYRLNLATKDNKKIDCVCGAGIWKDKEASFRAPLRGTYFGAFDKVEISDIFGFFRFAYKVFCTRAGRLCCAPLPAEYAPAVSGFSGGETRREERSVRKTDNLIEQREYVPGDDPRRINWKLYGHSGSLFVREEDRAPPPHSVLALLICAETDPALFPPRHFGQAGPYKGAAPGAGELDALCECALSIAAEAGNLELLAGGSGVPPVKCNNIEETAKILSLFYAFPSLPGGKRVRRGGENSPPGLPENIPPAPENTPPAPENIPPALPEVRADAKILVLSLPLKDFSGTNTLDRFLEKHDSFVRLRKIEILFLFKSADLQDAAARSALLYGRKVPARAVKIPE